MSSECSALVSNLFIRPYCLIDELHVEHARYGLLKVDPKTYPLLAYASRREDTKGRSVGKRRKSQVTIPRA